MSIDPVSLFLRPYGRLARQSFWIGAGVLVVAGVVLSIVPVLGQAASLGLIWPWFCLLAQRLHDVGRSSRIAALVMAPMALGMVLSLIASLALMNPAVGLALLPVIGLIGVIAGLASLAALAFVVWIGVMPGHASPNAWGPAPGQAIQLGLHG